LRTQSTTINIYQDDVQRPAQFDGLGNIMERKNGDEELSLEGLELLLADEQAGIKEFDAADYLADPESIAAYLTRMLENDDDSRITEALGNVARSACMAKVADQTGTGREALCQALHDGATARLNTVNRVVQALGMKIVIVNSGR
jgi:probable addiction module antidote protein